MSGSVWAWPVSTSACNEVMPSRRLVDGNRRRPLKPVEQPGEEGKPGRGVFLASFKGHAF